MQFLNLKTQIHIQFLLITVYDTSILQQKVDAAIYNLMVACYKWSSLD